MPEAQIVLNIKKVKKAIPAKQNNIYNYVMSVVL